MNTGSLLRPTDSGLQRWLVVVVLTLAVAGLLGAGGLMRAGAGQDDLVPHSGAPSAQAEVALRQFVLASDTAYQRPDEALDDVENYATEAMVNEVSSAVMELQWHSMRQRGRVTVGKVDVRSAAPTSVELAACLNAAGVAVVDKSGADLRGGQRPAARSLHYYTVDLVEGSWKVSSHSFPNDPDC